MLYQSLLSLSSKLSRQLQRISGLAFIVTGGLVASLAPIQVEVKAHPQALQPNTPQTQLQSTPNNAEVQHGPAQASPTQYGQSHSDEAAAPHSTATITPRQRALIEELLTLTRQEALFEQTLTAAMEQVTANLPTIMQGMMGDAVDVDAIASSQATLERIMTKLIAGFQSEIQFQDVAESVYYPLYAQNFTEAQLEDMIDFYQTPTGQHTIAVMPKLVQDSMLLTQQHLMPSMISIMQNVMAEELETSQQQ